MSTDKTVPEIISEKGVLTPEEMEKVLCPRNMTEPSGFAIKK